MEFNPLPDLLNTGFTIVEIGCFMVANIWEQKYTDHFKMAIFDQYLIGDGDVWNGSNT